MTEENAALSPGDRLGPYSITSRLGAGGMGEVYAAEDTRLGRTVAIKVLPAHVTGSAQARARFEREAKLVSSLNHSHICALFDVGQQDDMAFLVMEYLEGETLGTRLERGPLALDPALEIGAQIAAALDSAHRQGVAHRDLKPHNIMLTTSGAKLLDFGLAKMADDESGPQADAAPTVTSPLTTEGTLVGTVGYMAPEQLEGREADARSDIFALGLVLYEMITGHRAFRGTSVATVIAAILKDEPQPLSAIQPTAPAALDRLVRTCLAKNPEARWKSAADLQRQLEWMRQDLSGWQVAEVPRRRHRLGTPLGVAGWAVSAALILAWLIAAWRGADRPVPEAPLIRARVDAPFRATLADMLFGGAVVISPDGRRVVMITRDGEAWIINLSTGEASLLRGARDAHHPFWSPDSRSLAFFSPDGKLMRIPSEGGVAQEICDVVDGRGGAWSEDGTILLSPNIHGPLFAVSDAGGEPRPLTPDPGGEKSHRFPRFLPDSRHFVFLENIMDGVAGTIMLASLDDPTPRHLVDCITMGSYADGHLLYVEDDALFARPLDVSAGKLTGRPIPLATDLMAYGPMGLANFSLSRSGALVYLPVFRRQARLHWLDANSGALQAIGPAGDFETPSLSPDGSRVVVGMVAEGSREGQHWLFDVTTKTLSRLILPRPVAREGLFAVWSPDSRRLVWNDQDDVLLQLDLATGTVDEIGRLAGPSLVNAWSRDGRYLLTMQQNRETKVDTVVLDLEADNQLVPVAQTEAQEFPAGFSPDGGLVAYLADDPHNAQKSYQLYLTEFPGPGRTWQITTGGAAVGLVDQAAWRPDGTRLYYLDASRRLMEVEIGRTGGLTASSPRVIFESPTGIDSVAAAPDGRLLLLLPLESRDRPALHLLVNWTAALTEQAD